MLREKSEGEHTIVVIIIVVVMMGGGANYARSRDAKEDIMQKVE